MSIVVGHVAELRSYPVKGLDAAPVDAATVLAGGLRLDRAFAVLDADGSVVRAKHAPALADVRAVPPAADGALPGVLLPGADEAVAGAAADAGLSAVVGRAVRLGPVGPVGSVGQVGSGAGAQAAVHLVSRQAVDRAAADGPAAVGSPAGCDTARPRANVLLELTGAGYETAWIGRQLEVGAVVLAVRSTPRHCLGVYADVVSTGVVHRGDEVRLR